MSVSWVRSRCKPTDQPKETLMYPDPARAPAVMASPVVLPLHIEFEEERLTSDGGLPWLAEAEAAGWLWQSVLAIEFAVILCHEAMRSARIIIAQQPRVVLVRAC